jgi:hypothetical protein
MSDEPNKRAGGLFGGRSGVTYAESLWQQPGDPWPCYRAKQRPATLTAKPEQGDGR